MPVVKKTKHGDWEGRIRFPVWSGYCVHIVVGDSLAKSKLCRFPDSDPEPLAAALHLRAPLDGHDAYIFLTMDSNPGEIAHEAYHAVRYMIEDWARGEATNEVIAYHLGYVVERIHALKSAIRGS